MSPGHHELPIHRSQININPGYHHGFGIRISGWKRRRRIGEVAVARCAATRREDHHGFPMAMMVGGTMDDDIAGFHISMSAAAGSRDRDAVRLGCEKNRAPPRASRETCRATGFAMMDRPSDTKRMPPPSIS